MFLGAVCDLHLPQNEISSSKFCVSFIFNFSRNDHHPQEKLDNNNHAHFMRKLRLLVLLQKKYLYNCKNIVTKPNLEELLRKLF